jgi:hypothetical protein
MISTREKSLSARSRRVGSVRGKFIIVPRMKTSANAGRRAANTGIVSPMGGYSTLAVGGPVAAGPTAYFSLQIV